MTAKHRLGDLQLAILRELWRRGEASVTEVHAALEGERGLAPTTIATMLRKLEDKGAVTHRAEGRKFIYRPAVSEAAVRRTMVGELTERLFRGEVTALVSHLLAEHEVDAEEVERLKAVIARHESSLPSHTGPGPGPSRPRHEPEER
jgi:BlaI family transcriptional regulator, penicillinase repressor